MADSGQAPYAPDYASYNWTGAPANFALATNTDLGGDSSMSLVLVDDLFPIWDIL